MKAKPETLQELRTLILESEGITSEDELGEGCVVIIKAGQEWQEGELTMTDEKDESDKYGPKIGNREWTYHIKEILGKPITGERVLNALNGEKTYLLASDGRIGTVGELIDNRGINWTLCQPAQEQSEEEIQKIIKLLK